jgi:hypothetical protein
MTVDQSTLNLILGSLIALQVWTVREVYTVKGKLSNLELRLDISEKIEIQNRMKKVVSILILGLLCLLPFGCSTSGKLVKPIQDVQTVTPQPDGTLVTNVVSVVAPEWLATLDGIEATGALVPPPYGSWLSLGAAGIAALLAAWARNRQKSAESVAETIIQGIESMNATVAPSAKEAVNAVSKIKGNVAEVHAAVKKLTR